MRLYASFTDKEARPSFGFELLAAEPGEPLKTKKALPPIRSKQEQRKQVERLAAKARKQEELF